MTEDELDLVFKALADKTRRKIISSLHERGDLSLFDVCQATMENGRVLSRQTISQHLAVLEAAKLIETKFKGRTKSHRLAINEAHVAAADWLKQFKVTKGE